jgi:riboflavin kinase/FMN adenylyltransferase
VKHLQIIENTLDFQLHKETAVAIGKFDGIHVGHRELLSEIMACKEKGLMACVFTFDPAPAVFFGHSDGMELTTKEEKRLIFERMGVDVLIEFPLNRESAAIPAREFVEKVLVGQLKMKFLAAGSDLSFGAGGKGNAALLQEMGQTLAFSLQIIDKVCVEGIEVSSTYVRSQVEKSNMELVSKLLGGPYTILGEVVKGRQIGRTIGFPTVNLTPQPTKLLPGNGVYRSIVRLKGREYAAITNVGCKPTVTDAGVRNVETYLYDFQEDLYSEQIEVCLVAFHRPEQKFESLEHLKEQLERDIAECGA